MKKTIIAPTVGAALAVGSITANAALITTDTLTINQGANAFAQPADGNGSWFAMEALGPGGWVYTGIGGITGGSLKLDGTSQFSRAAGVAPQLTEVAGIDNAWTFFGSTGVHGSNGLTAQAGNTVNMSGWYVSWNNVASIDMGQGAAATVTCSDAGACGNGANYILNYSANVPATSANFPGVAYKLHLEGKVSAVPVPAAVWLFGSGLLGLVGVARRKKSA